MHTPNLAQSLARHIEFHATGHRTGGRESHTLTSLAARIGTSTAVAQKLIDKKILVPEGQVHRGDNTRLAFFCDDLNSVRHQVLSAVVCGVIDSAHSAEEVELGAPKALADHVATFCTKPAKDHVDLDFRWEEDRQSTIRKAATIAAAGATIYGAQALLRGRQPGRSVVGAIAAGHAANVADVRRVGNALKPSIGKAATATGNALATASIAVKRAGAAMLKPRRI